MKWDDAIKADFMKWVKSNPSKMPMTEAQFDAMMKERNW
jgi:hypothetical protein